MRVKHRKGDRELLAAHPELVLYAAADWPLVFGNDRPIQVELGCGKGDFILGMAERQPEINFVAIDLQPTVLSYALDKLLLAGLNNVRLLLSDGSDLSSYFGSHQIDQLYLNFSDPWPKRRHEKRRLTSPGFLTSYKKVLTENGQLAFKTDNRQLFEYSLTSLSQFGFVLEQVWLDLHKDLEFATENILTEYERKFSAEGPIYRLVAHFK